MTAVSLCTAMGKMGLEATSQSCLYWKRLCWGHTLTVFYRVSSRCQVHTGLGKAQSTSWCRVVPTLDRFVGRFGSHLMSFLKLMSTLLLKLIYSIGNHWVLDVYKALGEALGLIRWTNHCLIALSGLTANISKRTHEWIEKKLMSICTVVLAQWDHWRATLKWLCSPGI